MNNWVLENLVSTDELFEEALQIQETCLSVNNNSCGKLVSSFELPVMLGDILIVISVSFLVAAFYSAVALIILHLIYCIELFHIFKN